MNTINSAQTAAASPSAANMLELKDIHIPEPISNYPMAYGWWLLAALLIIVIIFAITYFRKRAQLQKIQKQALKQLNDNHNLTNTELIAILKWAGMHYFSRHELAKLYGAQFQQFLSNQLPEKYQQSFIQLSTQSFDQQYHDASTQTEQNSSNETLRQATTLWLTKALPPKVNKSRSPVRNDVEVSI